MGLRNGTRVPKGGFVAAKHPAKWGFGCEIGSFYASQPFRSYKKPCEIRLWLLNWDFLCFAAVSQLGDHFVAKWHFRIGGEFSQPISQLKSDFATQR